MLLSQRCVCIFPGANQPTSQRAARPTTDPGNHKKETEIKKKKTLLLSCSVTNKKKEQTRAYSLRAAAFPPPLVCSLANQSNKKMFPKKKKKKKNFSKERLLVWGISPAKREGERDRPIRLRTCALGVPAETAFFFFLTVFVHRCRFGPKNQNPAATQFHSRGRLFRPIHAER